MNVVEQLVDALDRDPSIGQTLRDDPASLAGRFNFGAAATAALHRADKFFDTEKPIFDRPLAAVAPHSQAADMVFIGGQPTSSGLAATPDTGTLLPGPPTEGYTITSSATATTTTSPPSQPAVPTVPAVPVLPQGPAVPTIPATPSAPAVGPQPAQPSPAIPARPPLPVQVCEHCHNTAIAALVANVANVAAVAITAIAASTAHSPGCGCRSRAYGGG
jgi:hypothetical protein